MTPWYEKGLGRFVDLTIVSVLDVTDGVINIVRCNKKDEWVNLSLDYLFWRTSKWLEWAEKKGRT